MSQDYPKVYRTADPLLIRPCRLALQVDDTTYYAKVKFGNKFCGYYIYANATGYHIYEYKDEQLTQDWSGDSTRPVPQISQQEVQEQLEQEAQEWLDALQEAIREHPSDNEIKKALDRLTYQLHYDATGSSTDFATQFHDEGFSVITIDKPSTDNEFPTIPDTVSTIVGEEGTTGTPGTGTGIWSVSNNLNAVNTELGNIKAKIGDFDTHLAGSSGAIKQYVGDVLYNASSTLTVCGYLNKIATNLRADDSGNYQEYTISRALREYVPGASSQEKSVSGATKEQTDLEQQSFNEISVNQLGAFGEGDSGAAGHRTLYATLGEYTQANKDNLSQAVGLTIDTSSSSTLTGTAKKIDETLTDANNGLVAKVSSTKSVVDTIDANVGHPQIGADPATGIYWATHNTNANVDSIKTTTDSITNNNIVAKINNMNDMMFGSNGYSGFVATHNNGQYSTYYVKSATPGGGWTWQD